MYERMKEEPTLVTALVQAVLAVGVSFGLGLTPEQVGSILAATAAVLALMLRQRVSPVPAASASSSSPEPQPVEG